jgi:hypothetical protein
MKDENRKRANTACSVHPIPCKERRGHGGGTRHVFEQFAWLGVGSVKVALSRPAWWLSRVETHQRVTRAVSHLRVPHKAEVSQY